MITKDIHINTWLLYNLLNCITLDDAIRGYGKLLILLIDNYVKKKCEKIYVF